MLEKLRRLSARALVELGSVRDREDGQAMVEYALIIFMVAIVSIAILGTLGGRVSSMFSVVTSEFP